MTLLARCPQCDASWRVRGIQSGERLTCPFCSSAFSFSPVPGATVAIPRADIPQADDTLTLSSEGSEGLLGTLGLPDNIQITLEILNGSQKGSCLEIKHSRTTLGRGAGEISLNDLQISRKHAVIEVYGDRYILLRDLASTNGTYVNGAVISQTKVENDDILRFGFTEMRLRVERRPLA